MSDNSEDEEYPPPAYEEKHGGAHSDEKPKEHELKHEDSADAPKPLHDPAAHHTHEEDELDVPGSFHAKSKSPTPSPSAQETDEPGYVQGLMQRSTLR